MASISDVDATFEADDLRDLPVREVAGNFIEDELFETSPQAQL